MLIEQKPEIALTEIQAFSQYQELLEKLKNTPDSIGISIDLMNKIYISFRWQVYLLDTKKIDISELIEAIFSGSIAFASYEPKEILGKLYKIWHPNISVDKLQESLF